MVCQSNGPGKGNAEKTGRPRQIALRTCREILRPSSEFPDVIGYDQVLLLALLG